MPAPSPAGPAGDKVRPSCSPCANGYSRGCSLNHRRINSTIYTVQQDKETQVDKNSFPLKHSPTGFLEPPGLQETPSLSSSRGCTATQHCTYPDPTTPSEHSHRAQQDTPGLQAAVHADMGRRTLVRQSTEGDVPQLRLPTPTGTRHTHAQAHAHVPHTPVHAHASTHVHTCILMHTPYIQPMHSCMHAHTSHTHACTHAYVHTHMLIHKCTSNMLMHIPPTHACIHTHVCTHTENKPGPSSPSLPYPAKTTAWPRRAAFCLPGPSLALSTHIRPHPVSPTVTQSKLCLSAEMSPQEPGLALLPMSTPAGRAGHPLPPRPQNLGHVAQGRVRPGNFLGWPTGRPGPQG